MTQNPLRQLASIGQAVWLDDIRRSWIADGQLARLIAEDGVTGVTSNPAIFEKAIVDHPDYDSAIASILAIARPGRNRITGAQMYESLVVDDIQRVADLLRCVYDTTQARDGYVSLEVSPLLAYDTEATIAEAQRLWRKLARPNVMIKVPATSAGLVAIRRLIAEGINVNATLLFSVARYGEVADAHLLGLEDRFRGGLPLATVASVASFFISRIDTRVDTALGSEDGQLQSLRGTAAICSAALAYQHFLGLVDSARWKVLASNGGQPQRLLWASTSTKHPAYRDVKYVESLVAPNTVITLPISTLTAYRNHGKPDAPLRSQANAAHALLAQLAKAGVSLDDICQQLESDGVRIFVDHYDRLIDALARRTAMSARA